MAYNWDGGSLLALCLLQVNDRVPYYAYTHWICIYGQGLLVVFCQVLVNSEVQPLTLLGVNLVAEHIAAHILE